MRSVVKSADEPRITASLRQAKRLASEMPQALTFGPEGDGWVYDRNTKSYDLARGASSARFTIRTTAGPPDTSITIAPSRSALVVVDMQNYFLHPRCSAHPSGLAAVERTLEVIERCRDIGVKIIWLNWGLAEEDLGAMPAAAQRSFASNLILPPSGASTPARNGFGSDMGEGRGRLLMAGSWNARLYDPLQVASRADADLFCDKDRVSGLWHGETPLARALAAGGFRTLLFAGVNTDQCVLGTLADAYYQGWDCVMVDDCCATTTPGGQEVSVYNAAKVYGFVVNSKSILEGSIA
ncbi:isochorismatase [Durotheca rogersii]|uniref:isochorismatase n=1 Tax=Durotheca rogersii TaxID=419775 RepID=UPI00221E5471|nr:isochorismatase [Durotheca rogersii]KAI5859532.1 isochorismatase [Durotheca rogersii]